MSDLVERLRAFIPGEPSHEEFVPPRLAEAADEIEALKRQHDILAGWLVEKDAEIEKLRSQLDKAQDLARAVSDIPYFKNPRIEEIVRAARDFLDGGLPTVNDVRGILSDDQGAKF